MFRTSRASAFYELCPKKACLAEYQSASYNTYLECIICICHVDGPTEFLSLGFIVNLLQRNFMLLAPGDRYTRVAGSTALVILLRGFQLLLRSLDCVLLSLDLDVDIFHRFIMGFGDRTLMVTQDSNGTIGSVVTENTPFLISFNTEMFQRSFF